MTDIINLDHADLPRPDVSAADAAVILAAHYGLEGEITELGSQQDRNYRIATEFGTYVLKINRAEHGTLEIDAQNAAMRHLAGGSVRVPDVCRARDGAEILPVTVRGSDYLVRLLGYLDGKQLTRIHHLPVASREALGRLAATVSLGLADLRHHGLDRTVQWDLRIARQTISHMLPNLAEETRARIDTVMDQAEAALAPLVEKLRVQPVHHDITDDNVVARPDAHGNLIPDGVIDFGDMVNGWLVAELASTCSALLHHADGDALAILPTIRAFHEVYPLIEAEIDALWPLIMMRAAVLLASGEQQLSIDPDNDYVLGNIAHEREIFDVATSVPLQVMQGAIRQALGLHRSITLPAISPMLPDVPLADVRIVELDVTSDHWDRFNWDTAGIDRTILQSARIDTGFAATRYGEHRLSETRTPSPTIPETYSLFVDLCLPAGTRFAAPFNGQLSGDLSRARFMGEGLSLILEGMEPSGGGQYIASDTLGTVSDGGIVRLWLVADATLEPRAFCRPDQAAIYRTLYLSPSAVVGLAVDAPEPQNETLLARRNAHFAKPQKNYYARPPQIERGRGEYMFDVNGRAFLDMVNNVTMVGHGHPRLARAVGRQWQRLNTNSRFHYAGVAEFSERLAGLAPEGLDTVFLVNSGSEAVDLAIRLAWAHSGARNIVSLLEAYHGWTVASDAVSTSIADNPAALETRPAWVHPVMAPNSYRGAYRGPESGPHYVRAVIDALDRIAAKGESLAGFIAESVYGNAGGIPLPDGYLREVYRMVRERGGMCIADEVQVGYGRLGHYFWGFEQQSVVPDIITIAKGMGNGQPLGAVITRREIADSLEREGYFFSSAGGSPVSCVVGMTVLDIMRDEDLQANARTVGDHLKARLEALGQRFPIVGACHGMGLYLGLEFIRDRETLEPATEETMAICNRLLELGVIMQPTGDYLNVLKIKPPLCLTMKSADFFADMLTRVLEEGW